MNKLILTIGIPGCGKSYWSKNYILDKPDFIRVCPDEIREELTGDINNQSRNKEVWETTRDRINELLNTYNVILDATNVNTKSRNKFLKSITTPHELHFKVLPISFIEASERIRKDIDNHLNRSNVPNEVMVRMYSNYIETMKVLDKTKFI